MLSQFCLAPLRSKGDQEIRAKNQRQALSISHRPLPAGGPEMSQHFCVLAWVFFLNVHRATSGLSTA